MAPGGAAGTAGEGFRRGRLRACVEAWPDAETGAYDPHCCRFPKSCSATVYDPEHVTAADLEPAAPVVRAEDAAGGLREQVARWLYLAYNHGDEWSWDNLGTDHHARRAAYRSADAVLALPALRELAAAAEEAEKLLDALIAVRAKRDTLAKTVRRVEALADEWLRPTDYTSYYRDGLRDAARAIRRALDGEEQP